MEKKLYNIFVILLLFFTTKTYSQNIILKIDGFKKTIASLYSLELGLSNKIGTTVSNNQGVFTFNANKLNLNPGLYRIYFESSKWFDFIYERNDIEIHSTKNNLQGSLKVIKSESNKLYYTFLSLHNNYKKELNKLVLFGTQGKNNSQEFEIQKEIFEKIKNRYIDFLAKAINKKSFVSRYIKSMQAPVPEDIKRASIKQYLVNHSLDNVDFNDVGLIYSDVFVNKVIELIGYYTYPNLTKVHQEKKYIIAVDEILNKAKVDELVYQGISEFLIEGFKKLNYTVLIDYIINNYILPDDLCLDDQTDKAIQMRINQAKVFKEGITVPNIVLPKTNNEQFNLYKFNIKNKLILFYSSSCPHCKEIIPKLVEFYNKNRNNDFYIIAISLDYDRSEWLNYIKQNSLNWINISDLLGWKSKVTFDYFVYATPTMFLVDRKNKLLGKPKTIEELKNLLKDKK